MTEILIINIQILILFLFFNTYTYIIKKKTISTYFSLYDCISINILIQFSILLIFSFFKINLVYYFYINLFISILSLIYLVNKSYFDASVLIFYIFCFCIFVEIARFNDLGWDALAHWIYKVQIFRHGGEIKDLLNIPFPFYPHLGSYIWSFFWNTSIADYEYIGRLFIPFIYLVSVFSICKLIKNQVFFYFTLIIVLFLNHDLFIFSGYQEYIIFSILLILSRFIFFGEYFKNKVFFLLLISLSSLVLIWTKDEGVFFLIFVLISLIGKFYKFKKELFIYSAAVLLIIIFSYFLEYQIKGGVKFQADLDLNLLYSRFNLEYLIHFIFKLHLHLMITFFKYPLIIISLISFLICMKEKILERDDIISFLSYLFLFYLFIISVYFSTPYELNDMLPNSLDRIVLQFSGFIIFPLIKLLNRYS